MRRCRRKCNLCGADGSESRPKWNPIEIAFAAAKIWIAIADTHTHTHTHTFGPEILFQDPFFLFLTYIFFFLVLFVCSTPWSLVYPCSFHAFLLLRIVVSRVQLADFRSFIKASAFEFLKCLFRLFSGSILVANYVGRMSLSFSDSDSYSDSNARTWQID